MASVAAGWHPAPSNQPASLCRHPTSPSHPASHPVSNRPATEATGCHIFFRCSYLNRMNYRCGRISIRADLPVIYWARKYYSRIIAQVVIRLNHSSIHPSVHPSTQPTIQPPSLDSQSQNVNSHIFRIKDSFLLIACHSPISFQLLVNYITTIQVRANQRPYRHPAVAVASCSRWSPCWIHASTDAATGSPSPSASSINHNLQY